jgi:hypothetical protein
MVLCTDRLLPIGLLSPTILVSLIITQVIGPPSAVKLGNYLGLAYNYTKFVS